MTIDRETLAFVLSDLNRGDWSHSPSLQVFWSATADRLLAAIASGTVKIDAPKRKTLQLMEWHDTAADKFPRLMRVCDDGTIWERIHLADRWRLCDWPEETT